MGGSQLPKPEPAWALELRMRELRMSGLWRSWTWEPTLPCRGSQPKVSSFDPAGQSVLEPSIQPL